MRRASVYGAIDAIQTSLGTLRDALFDEDDEPRPWTAAECAPPPKQPSLTRLLLDGAGTVEVHRGPLLVLIGAAMGRGGPDLEDVAEMLLGDLDDL